MVSCLNPRNRGPEHGLRFILHGRNRPLFEIGAIDAGNIGKRLPASAKKMFGDRCRQAIRVCLPLSYLLTQPRSRQGACYSEKHRTEKTKGGLLSPEVLGVLRCWGSENYGNPTPQGQS